MVGRGRVLPGAIMRGRVVFCQGRDLTQPKAAQPYGRVRSRGMGEVWSDAVEAGLRPASTMPHNCQSAPTAVGWLPWRSPLSATLAALHTLRVILTGYWWFCRIGFNDKVRKAHRFVHLRFCARVLASSNSPKVGEKRNWKKHRNVAPTLASLLVATSWPRNKSHTPPSRGSILEVSNLSPRDGLLTSGAVTDLTGPSR